MVLGCTNSITYYRNRCNIARSSYIRSTNNTYNELSFHVRKLSKLQRERMVELIIYIAFTALMVIAVSATLAEIERHIDLKIIRGKIINQTFIKHKHLLYSIPRIPFFVLFLAIARNEPSIGITIGITNATALALLFRFMHDSYYHYYVKLTETQIGKGFKQDKITNNYLGSSIIDKFFADTWKNRKICLAIWALISIAEILSLWL